MTCENLVGVKNIGITFYNCATDTRIGPIIHKLATEELPKIKVCVWNNEALTHGYTKRTAANATMEMSVIRDLRIPLEYYQGCAGVDVQIEYENGLVYTGRAGHLTGDESSDTHEVMLEINFSEIDELRPAGALAA